MSAFARAKNETSNGSQVALYIDFENVAISAQETFGRLDMTVLVQFANQFGRCVIRRAYGDWTRYGHTYSQDLLEHSTEAIQMFHFGGASDENAADIQMVADILEMLFIHPEVDVYVLATGDSDFSAVARKLRSYGKTVIGIGLRRATSEVLVNACDQFQVYDTIVEPKTRTQSYSIEQARQLRRDVMMDMTRQSGNDMVLAASLKNMMLQKDRTFSETHLGFSQFRDFLIEQNDLVGIDTRENQVVVKLLPTVAEKAAKDPTADYRRAIDRDGLHLLDPYTRVDVLQDFFQLIHANPSKYTLEGAAMHLKAHYDTTNILRSRDEVHEAVRLAKYTSLIVLTPQSWEMGTLSFQADLEQQAFVDACESVYIAALANKNLPIKDDLIAKLLFGTVDKRARVKQLYKLVQSQTRGESQKVKEVKSWQWPSRLAENLSLKKVLVEIEEYPLAESEVTLDRAMQANEEGMRVRSTDFEQARCFYLEAGKIMYLLLKQNAPGASTVDLEWFLGSYCASAAGAAFFRHDYPTALQYYQAFFVVAVETEPVWEKLDRLIQPMLSFYFTVAANLGQVTLEASPGRQHPAQIVAMIFTHENQDVQQRGADLARKLARINPTLLRKIIQRLEAITTDSDSAHPAEARTLQVLQEILEAGE